MNHRKRRRVLLAGYPYKFPVAVEYAVNVSEWFYPIRRLGEKLIKLEDAQARADVLLAAYHRHYDLLRQNGVAPAAAKQQAREHALAEIGESGRSWDEFKSSRTALTRARERLTYMKEQDALLPVVYRFDPAPWHYGGYLVINLSGDLVLLHFDGPTGDDSYFKRGGFRSWDRSSLTWEAKYSDKALSFVCKFINVSPDALVPPPPPTSIASVDPTYVGRSLTEPAPARYPPAGSMSIAPEPIADLYPLPPPPYHLPVTLDGRGIGRAQPATTIGTTPIPQGLGGIGKAMCAPVAPPPQQHGGIARSVSPFTAIQPPPTAPQVVVPLPVTAQPVVSLPVASGPIARPLVAFPPASPLAAPQSVATQLAAPTQAEAPHGVPPPVVPSAGDVKV